MRSFLDDHSIALNERPVRRHNKSGVVERKNLTLKRIPEKLQFGENTPTDTVLLSRATFLSNVFSGSRSLSSFELVRGYTPAVLGLPSSAISSELLSAYKQQAATRALQRLLSSRAPSTIPPSMLKEGTPILYFYKSSKQSEPVEWRSGTVVSAEPHLVRIKNALGRSSSIAYEDLHLRPESNLARDLMEPDTAPATAQPERGVSHSIITFRLRPINPCLITNSQQTQRQPYLHPLGKILYQTILRPLFMIMNPVISAITPPPPDLYQT